MSDKEPKIIGVDVLRPGESVLIDYGKMESYPINTRTGKRITDPKELAEFEEASKPIREKARAMYKEWEESQRKKGG